MNVIITQEEMEIIAYEVAKQERKDQCLAQSFRGMSDEEIAECLRLEEERYEAELAEDRAEDAWQAWNGNPLYISREELRLHEIALDHESIEMSLMG
jgi:hypothetical protein